MVKAITGIIFGVALMQFAYSPEGRAIADKISRYLDAATTKLTDGSYDEQRPTVIDMEQDNGSNINTKDGE